MVTLVETPWGEDSEDEVMETTAAPDEEAEDSTEDIVIEEKEIHDDRSIR